MCFVLRLPNLMKFGNNKLNNRHNVTVTESGNESFFIKINSLTATPKFWNFLYSFLLHGYLICPH
jgi:hypothetical protein